MLWSLHPLLLPQRPTPPLASNENPFSGGSWNPTFIWNLLVYCVWELIKPHSCEFLPNAPLTHRSSSPRRSHISWHIQSLWSSPRKAIPDGCRSRIQSVQCELFSELCSVNCAMYSVQWTHLFIMPHFVRAGHHWISPTLKWPNADRIRCEWKWHGEKGEITAIGSLGNWGK